MKKAVENEVLIAKISKLLDSLNIKYENISHYIQAFIHRSIVNERPDYAPTHNERLEFLGDAVLELIITKNLFNDFPNKSEGDLTDIRSALVRGTNLAKIANNLGLHEFLILGKGEELGGGRENNYLLANVVEALLGAIYLDGGIESATTFVDKHIYRTIDDILQNNLTKDYKTLIQELAQGKFDITPTYKIISESGPDHDKDFVVGVYLGEKIIGEGNGSSKKKAQENAALNGFNKINT